MIVVKLIGGLGNQMFQYAAGSALASLHDTKLYLDTSHLNIDSNNAYTKREFELGKLNINANIANQQILNNFNFNESKWMLRLKKTFPKFFKKIIFNEHHFNFHKVFFDMPATTYLNGYWQSEKYFLNIKHKLISEFSLLKNSSEKTFSIEQQIKKTNSVSIHVRRGDFVSLKSATNFHGNLKLDYYKEAVDIIKSKIENPTFFIFSDDINWCCNQFEFLESKFFVDSLNLNTSAHDELALMQLCKHNIIANSSFSWWGAWLNLNPDKICIAPKNWFAVKNLNTADLIPKTWIEL